MTTAAGETLGPGSSFVVQEVASPFQTNASALEMKLGAGAVVELVWSSDDRTRAILRVHIARLDKWIRHEIVFRPADSLTERGRTLGYAVASILATDGEWKPSPALAPPSPPAPRRPAPAVATKQATPPKAPSPAPSRVPEGATDRASGERAARESKPAPETGPPPEPTPEPTRKPKPRSTAPPRPAAIDLRGLGSVGLGGSATGLGLAAHGEYLLAPTFWLSMTVAGRTGSVPNLDGFDSVGSALAGLTWRPFVSTAKRPVTVGVGLEAGALVHVVKHQIPSAATRVFKPAAATTVELAWRVAASWDLLIAGTLECAFGAIDVDLETVSTTTRIATIPAFRGLLTAGVRLRF
jgi:hypothetical protein